MASVQGCPTVPLSNGLQIPIFGLGTSHDGGYSHDAIVYALTECGVRHIDTAKRYGCEEMLGRSIRDSGLARSDLWLTNKLWPGDYGYEDTRKACLDSCSRMGVEYFDLFMMHWPGSQKPGRSNREMRADTWRALEELHEEGVCRAIGVSNFMVHHLEQLKEDCSEIPHVNQVEYHPYQQTNHVKEYCREEGIVFEGYSPLAKGQVLSDPTVLQIAEKYRRTPAQICIRWSIQNGVVTIPKSTKKKRIQENFEFKRKTTNAGAASYRGRKGWNFCDLRHQPVPPLSLSPSNRAATPPESLNAPWFLNVFDFHMEEEDMAALGRLHDGRHVSWDPTNVE